MVVVRLGDVVVIVVGAIGESEFETEFFSVSNGLVIGIGSGFWDHEEC